MLDVTKASFQGSELPFRKFHEGISGAGGLSLSVSGAYLSLCLSLDCELLGVRGGIHLHLQSPALDTRLTWLMVGTQGTCTLTSLH